MDVAVTGVRLHVGFEAGGPGGLRARARHRPGPANRSAGGLDGQEAGGLFGRFGPRGRTLPHRGQGEGEGKVSALVHQSDFSQQGLQIMVQACHSQEIIKRKLPHQFARVA